MCKTFLEETMKYYWMERNIHTYDQEDMFKISESEIRNSLNIYQ